MNRLFVQSGNKGYAKYSPLPSTSKQFLNPALQGIYFVKGTLSNESLRQLPTRKLSIKGNANLAVDFPVETNLSQSEMIKDVPMSERKIRTMTKKCQREPSAF